MTLNTLPPNTQIGSYTLVRQLGDGQGRMAQVYAATRTGDAAAPTVALKIANVRNRQGDFYTSALQTEVEQLRQLHHPHLVQLLPIDPAMPTTFLAQTDLPGKPYYLVLEYLAHDSLATMLRQLPAGLPLLATLALGYALASLLDYLHARQCIHMDIKPANLLLRRPITADDAGEVVLIDFGSAGRINQAVLDRTATLLASPYLPLEWLNAARQGSQGEVLATPAIDIYALGVTLYQLLTGRLPFAASEPNQLAALLAAGQPPKPSQFFANNLAKRNDSSLRPLVEELDGLILNCLQQQPALRPSAGLLAEQLVPLQRGLGALLTERPPLPTRSARPSIPRRTGAFLAGAAFFVVGLATGVGLGVQPSIGGLLSPTATLAPTATPPPTLAPTVPPTPTYTATPKPTPTPVPTATPLPTATPVPTEPPTLPPTATATPASTLAATPTPAAQP